MDNLSLDMDNLSLDMDNLSQLMDNLAMDNQTNLILIKDSHNPKEIQISNIID